MAAKTIRRRVTMPPESRTGKPVSRTKLKQAREELAREPEAARVLLNAGEGGDLPADALPAPIVPRGRPQTGRIDWEQAVELKREIFADFHAGRVLSRFVTSDEAFAPARKPNAAALAMQTPWPFPTRFVVGVGVIPTTWPGHPGSDHRVAVRIQSEHRPRLAVLRAMAQELDGRYGLDHTKRGRAQVRWTGLVTCPSDSDGDYGRWGSGYRSGEPARIGAPISTPGGPVCTLTLVRQVNGRVLGLTVGHMTPEPVHADSANRPMVYCPPHGGAQADRPLGLVEISRHMPHLRFQNGAMMVPPGASDHAVLDLEAHRLRAPEDYFELPNGQHATLPALVVPRDETFSQLRVYKTAAKTRQAPGTITAIDVAIEMWNPATGGTVGCDNLLEIQLDQNYFAKLGDSGTLIVVGDKIMKPLGMLVAKTDAGALPVKGSPQRGVIYAIPIAGIEGF